MTGGLPFSWNDAAQRAAAAADVQHERDAALLEQTPDRPVVRMRRGPVARRHRRHQDRAAAHRDRFLGRLTRELGIGEGDEADGDQPAVLAAELDHRAVVRTRAAVEQFEVVRLELGRRERAEHELRLEAEQVEGAAAFRRDRTRRARSSPWAPSRSLRTVRDDSGCVRRSSAARTASSASAPAPPR